MAKIKKPNLNTEAPTPEGDPHMFDRNVLNEGTQALQLMQMAYPQLLALQKKYGGAFARSEVDIASQRGRAEAAAVGKYGGQMRNAILKTSPEIRKANQSIMDRLNELGPSAIEKNLTGQALADLQLGGALSGEDTRNASQTARAAMQARGLGSGRTAAVAEVLKRQEFSEGRQNQRRAFASAVDSNVQQRKAGDAAISNNAFNTLGAFWDPQARLFGRGGSMVSGQVQGPNAFQPFLGAAQNVGAGNQQAQTSIYNANNGLAQQAYEFGINRMDSNYWNQMNMQASAQNAAATRSGNLLGAGIGAIGSLGGGALLGLGLGGFL